MCWYHSALCTKLFCRVPHIFSMSDGAKDCWRRKNTTNITMNISICTLLPFLFDLVLMHRRLHRGTSGKDRDMALGETENRTNEASDLSQKNYISLPILMCAFFHKTHHGELRFTYCQFISVCFFSIFLVHAIFCQAFSECFHSGFAQNKDLLWHTNVFY